MLRKITKFFAFTIGTLLLITLTFALYVHFGIRPHPPTPSDNSALDWKVTEASPGLFRINNNWFRKSESGLYELYAEGKPFERGVAIGKLTQQLVRNQEDAFIRQLHQLVPSTTYLMFLKDLVTWFNRDLANKVEEEFKLEIFGVSRSADAKYDKEIGPAFDRMLNYHAAHDIGHALQNISLVGCTSFATWNSASEDSSMIVGRNFDFYLGDDFGKEKIVAFYNPDAGHKFMMVTFGGMTGVLSGMNDAGLTVTINAAKSDIPPSAATPVSLVAREILQYASTIDEAYRIAQKRTMFVSESFLIASAKDGKAVLIEKSPEATDLVEGKNDLIISTNHFQGEPLGNTELNREHMKTSASPYRYERVAELLARNSRNSVLKTAGILRDQNGLEDKNIGRGNEKAINQLVAHHSIIFQPQKQLVWVSTSPWQLGKYVCYDLKKVFENKMNSSKEIYEADLTISADPFVDSKALSDCMKFNTFRFPFNPRKGMVPDSLVKWNPQSYLSYMLGGDYWFGKEQYAKAIAMYEAGLKCEVATLQEKWHMEKNLEKSMGHLK